MELLLWILIPVVAVIVIHYFEKKHRYQKERISAGLEIQSQRCVVFDNPNQVEKLRSDFIDMERQISSDEFRFVGATKNEQLDSVCLHYLSSAGDVVVSMSERTFGRVGEKMVEIGSETKSGEFHITSDIAENVGIKLPVALNNYYVEEGTTFDKKLEAHKIAVREYELREIKGIDGIVEGVNRMHSILEAHQISSFY